MNFQLTSLAFLPVMSITYQATTMKQNNSEKNQTGKWQKRAENTCPKQIKQEKGHEFLQKISPFIMRPWPGYGADYFNNINIFEHPGCYARQR